AGQRGIYAARWARIGLVLSYVLMSGCGEPGVEQRFARAEASFANYDYREAVIHARNTLQADDTHLGAHILLGRAALALGDLDDAIFRLGRARQLGASPLEYAAPLAMARGKNGELDDALQARDTVPVPARNFEYWLARADLLTRSGDFDAAEEAFDEADLVNGGANAAELFVARARLAMARRDVDAAGALLRQAIELDESHPEAWALSAAVALAS